MWFAGALEESLPERLRGVIGNPARQNVESDGSNLGVPRCEFHEGNEQQISRIIRRDYWPGALLKRQNEETAFTPKSFVQAPAVQARRSDKVVYRSSFITSVSKDLGTLSHDVGFDKCSVPAHALRIHIRKRSVKNDQSIIYSIVCRLRQVHTARGTVSGTAHGPVQLCTERFCAVSWGNVCSTVPGSWATIATGVPMLVTSFTAKSV